MKEHIPTAALLGVLFAACASGSQAPANLAPGLDYPVDTVSDCSSLDRLLAGGSVPAPHMAPALWRVQGCPGRAGASLARALRAIRTVTDTVAIERATWLGHYLHDRQLFDAAVDVASDTGAAEWARVAALRTLLWTKAPSQWQTLSGMLRESCPRQPCYSSYTGHYYHGMGSGDNWPSPAFGEALPLGYAERIDRIATDIINEPTTPERVRLAAVQLRVTYAEADYLKGR